MTSVTKANSSNVERQETETVSGSLSGIFSIYISNVPVWTFTESPGPDPRLVCAVLSPCWRHETLYHWLSHRDIVEMLTENEHYTCIVFDAFYSCTTCLLCFLLFCCWFNLVGVSVCMCVFFRNAWSPVIEMLSEMRCSLLFQWRDVFFSFDYINFFTATQDSREVE